MRKLFYLLFVLVTISSCSPMYYYQVCKLESDLLVEDRVYLYRSEQECVVAYDFREDGGLVRFVIDNKTDDILYVDLSKSFLIKNGVAYDYFLNRTIGTSKSVSSAKSKSESGTVYGYWKNIRDYKGNQYFGSITSTKSETMAFSESRTVSYIEKPIIAIPPHSLKVFSEYLLASDRFTFNNLREKPIGDECFTLSFDSSNTPLKFINYLCYKVGEDGPEKIIKNSFYVREISNQNNLGYITPKDFYIKYTCLYETVERNNYQEVEDISQTPGNTDSALTDNEKDNILEEENYEIYLKDESELSTRELEYLKLRKLKKSLEEGNIENLEEIKNEYKRINNWYRNITEVYPEIHNLLKEIKKLL